ncbi:hypothetical protein HNP52_000237 [Sphingomonas kyeonggiensis]|uniref:Glycerophosphoryl diester phosphodiesterase membrane domain-containing protein n=1 Tax=Sphingomonas kyeonggiensis TaxID=1268553 RepID=A0A7W7JXY6_9SPHN|nr:hypothetical protein [Sphingomonas kyeonggiensis]MBB4837186.1 hypothetical protein [Sphingomonas kyeonggiensis]
MEQKIDTALIVRNSFALLQANLRATLVAMLTLVAVATAADTIGSEGAGLNLAIGIGTMFAQYAVTRGALRSAGLLDAEGRAGRAGAFALATILSSLGIAIGFVFLILPGIYLWARWSMVAPLTVGEGMSSNQAMRESWSRTQSLVAPISAALLLLSVPLLLFVGTVFFYPDYGPVPIGLALLSNLLIYTAQALIWHAAVAIHQLTRSPSNDLEQVFA